MPAATSKVENAEVKPIQYKLITADKLSVYVYTDTAVPLYNISVHITVKLKDLVSTHVAVRAESKGTK